MFLGFEFVIISGLGSWSFFFMAMFESRERSFDCFFSEEVLKQIRIEIRANVLMVKTGITELL